MIWQSSRLHVSRVSPQPSSLMAGEGKAPREQRSATDSLRLPRQMHPRAEAPLGGGLEPNVATVTACHVSSDRQTEADASSGDVARRVEAHKGPEHPSPIGGRDPRAIIVDKDVDPIGHRDTVSQTWLP